MHAASVTNFVLLSIISYVIPSEVEESLALKSRTWRAITILDLHRNKPEPFCPVHRSDEQTLAANLGTPRRKWQWICRGLSLYKTHLLRAVSRYSRRNCAREPIEEMVSRQEGDADQSAESKLARLGCGRATGQIASRDFSTSLEMTMDRQVGSGAQLKLVTATRRCRSLVMVWMRSRSHG